MTTSREWHIRDRVLRFEGRALILGIVNVTPDSFSDGGRYAGPEQATAHGLELVRQGADLLDIGGESTRPGAMPVPVEEELGRVLPVVRALAAQTAVPLSIDTSKAEVAQACLEAGAHVINDVTGLRGDPMLPAVVREFGAGVIVMHMQGTPQTMQQAPRYGDVVAEIGAFFEERLHTLAAQGIPDRQVVLDPGIGFGKTSEHNWQLLARLASFQRLGRPVCLGVSRKGLLGRELGREIGQRLAGSLAAVCYALGRNAAQLVRVHDVAETGDAIRVYVAAGARNVPAPDA